MNGLVCIAWNRLCIVRIRAVRGDVISGDTVRVPTAQARRGFRAPLLRRMRQATFAIAILLLTSRLVVAQNLTVAAASDLQSVLPQIVAQFEKETGRTVRLTFGSSGNFVAQIRNGAPFDVFLSADA